MTATAALSVGTVLRILLPAALLCLLLPACEKEYSPRNAEQARSNLDLIARALERYAGDHEGCYPSRLEDLASEAYLTRFPVNAYKKSLPWIGAPRMKPLPPGSPPSNGDFVYVPGASSSRRGTCRDYRLFLYGDKRDVNLEEPITGADGVITDRVILLITGERFNYVPGKRI